MSLYSSIHTIPTAITDNNAAINNRSEIANAFNYFPQVDSFFVTPEVSNIISFINLQSFTKCETDPSWMLEVTLTVSYEITLGTGTLALIKF